MLVNNDYLKAQDAVKLFAAQGIRQGTVSGTNVTLTMTNSAFTIYKVADSDASTTLFATTKNYNYNTALTTNVPFKDAGFIAFRRGGDGQIFKKTQYNETNLIGNLPSIVSPLN